MARALAGDHGAFGALVDAYGRPVFNLALRMVGNYEDARDLAQIVFVKAYEKLGMFDRRHRFFSWIYRIAVNESLNLLSRRRWRGEPDEEIESGARGPEEECQALEEEAMVRRALMDLSAQYRQVIVLRHFMDLSHREMGELLRLPEKTVKSRLHTARDRLAEALRRRGYRAS